MFIKMAVEQNTGKMLKQKKRNRYYIERNKQIDPAPADEKAEEQPCLERNPV